MLFKNIDDLKNATFEPIEVHQVDSNGKPIYRGEGLGIDYSKVKPIE